MSNGRDKGGKFTAGNEFGGQSPGRPKKNMCIPDLLRKIGEEDGTTGGKTKLEVIMYKVYQYALEGKQWAVQFIADRTEGKAVERVQQELIDIEYTGDNAEEYVKNFLNNNKL